MIAVIGFVIDAIANGVSVVFGVASPNRRTPNARSYNTLSPRARSTVPERSPDAASGARYASVLR